MSLTVRNVSFSGYRNLGERELALDEGVTVLVGPNAVGKTNTVEALEYLTAGQSFRKPSPAELLAPGAAEARVAARLEGDGRVIDVELRVTPEKRRFLRNGKPCQARDLPGTLLSVLFCPDDLSLVKGSASRRRTELDAFGAQANAGYRKVLATYTRTVEQRNRLLRDGVGGALLDAWDESVAIGGATLLYHRLSLFARLSALVSEVYGEVVPTERLECRYKASVAEAGPDGVPVAPDGRPRAELGRGELTEVLRERLAAARPDDVRRCQTTVGPHRDDVQFAIDGRDARTFGSQGQQRTVALAWKMAEVRLCERLLGERPLLLLDDVMSELDESRRACVTRFVEGGIQTVITTTNLGYFTPELLERTRVVHYGQ